MRRLLAGGPLLGENGSPSKPFEPLITPLVTASFNSINNGEQFILLPHSRFIQVLAFRTGNAVANLIPFGSKDYLDVGIESVCLATYPSKPRDASTIFGQLMEEDNDTPTNNMGPEAVDHVVLVGCSDGSLREFPLRVLLASSFGREQQHSVDNNCGPCTLDGPCFGPRRTFMISQNQRIMHMAAPACAARTDYGLLVYALAQNQRPSTECQSKKNSTFPMSLIRLLLPPNYDNTIMERKEVIQLWQEGDDKGDSKFARIKKIDKVVCKEELQDDGTMFSTAPFRLEAVVRDRTQGLFNPGYGTLRDQMIYLVMAKPTAVHVYCERLADIALMGGDGDVDNGLAPKRFPLVSFALPATNCLRSMAVSTNKSDIACGLAQGHIVIQSNLLAHVEEYHRATERFENQTSADDGAKSSAGGIKKPEHPSRKVIKAKVHWHAHPVTTLCYDPNSSPTDPILYSGGEESVLVTWQLSRGVHRPFDLLPRIARRGIMHIICIKRTDAPSASNTNDSILVFCEDNTLQLFETHNKALLWKVRGLASKGGGLNKHTSKHPTITSDPEGAVSSSSPSSSHLVLYGLPDAPGMVQWYDPKQQRVVGHLEVAPYNRVSGMERKAKFPMPEPLVTQFSHGSTGIDLLTIDNVPTENEFVGAVEKSCADGDRKYGVVPTVRFWARTASPGLPPKGDETSKPYELMAAMAHPHGYGNMVNAATMSMRGNYACTVSNDELAFRLWHKTTGQEIGSVDHVERHESGCRRMPVWVCQCKVTIPSGFSNHPTGDHAVAFSSDSSVLAIGFGHIVAIWDRANMTLLTCLRHLSGEDAVDSIEFVKNDMVMCKSQSGVSIQPLFNTPDLVNLSWGWTVKHLPPPANVSCAQFLSIHDVVAISVYCADEHSSRVVLVDVASGEPAKCKQGALVERVPGIVASIMQSTSRTPTKSNWREEIDQTEYSGGATPLLLYALSSTGEMFELEEGTRTEKFAHQTQESHDSEGVPRLPRTRGSSSEPPTKRRRAMMSKVDQDQVKDRKLAVSNYGSMLDENGNAAPLQNSELPSLSGGFTRAFIGRNLSRGDS
jgi:hypothetical protein